MGRFRVSNPRQRCYGREHHRAWEPQPNGDLSIIALNDRHDPNALGNDEPNATPN